MMSALWSLNMTNNPKVAQLNAKDLVDSTGRILSETVQNSSTAFHRRFKIGMGVLAVTLLILAGISTGLILAICGLDQVSLHIKSATATPKEREYIRAVSRLKSHGTWMLCSLVICTVACSEYFPFVVQGMFPGPPWIAILISTFFITIFVELIPQFIIPASPLVWGFYCRPIIWTCMWLTALISFPTAYILSHICKDSKSREVFTNEELRIFIKYHEKSKKNGGSLSRDASQIMIGALDLDFHCIGDFSTLKPCSRLPIEEDLESARIPLRLNKIVTDWASVRMININDSLNGDFITKVKSWSYTRLPVIGRPERQLGQENFHSGDQWESIQIYGYLHVNSLIGCNFSDKNCSLSVRDLPLNPLPIVQKNMSIYALLNMLEKGISKIAVIVPSQKQETLTMLKRTSSKKTDPSPAMKYGMRQKSCDCIPNTSSIDDLVEAALMSADYNDSPSSINQGITLQRPVGLVTLDDIIGAILQRAARSGGDFFNLLPEISPSKNKNAERVLRHMSHSNGIPLIEIHREKQCKQESVLEKNGPALDGIDERNIRHNHSNSSTLKMRNSNARTSHTQICGDDNCRGMGTRNIEPLLPTHFSNTSNLSQRKTSRNSIGGSYRCASSGPEIPVIPNPHRAAPTFYQKNRNLGLKFGHNEKLKMSESSNKSDILVSPSLSKLSLMVTGPNSRKEFSCKENVPKNTPISSSEYQTQTKVESHFYGFGNSSKTHTIVNAPRKRSEASLDFGKNIDCEVYHESPVEIFLNSKYERISSSNYVCQTIPRSKVISCGITQDHTMMLHDDKCCFPIGRRLGLSDPMEYEVKGSRTLSF